MSSNIASNSKSFFKTKSLNSYLQSKDKLDFICLELVYDSNAIEGIFPEEIHTVHNDDYLEKYQLLDHAKAYEYVIDNYNNTLTSKEILNLHSMLMTNIFRLENNGIMGEAGEYRKNAVHIGPRYGLQLGGIHFKSIPKAISNLERDIVKLGAMIDVRLKNNSDNDIKIKYAIKNNWQDILKIHDDFETIHPFNDGNGRTGRLILNWLSLKYFSKFMIIDSDKKQDYYKHITDNRSLYIEQNKNILFHKDLFIKEPSLISMLERMYGRYNF